MRRFTLLSNSRTATTLFLSPGPTNTSIAINGSNQPEDCQRQSHILASAERRQRQVRSPDYSVTSSSSAASSTRRPQHRSLAQLRSHLPDEAYFTPSATPGFRLRNAGDSGSADGLDGVGSGGPGQGQGDHKPPDEKTLRLGKTLRTLSPLLPNILTTPVPPEILSPNISLHLFPSTHPSLPTVKGRVPYRAALWTAPVAWGSVPIVGNVKLEILSERVVRSGGMIADTLPGIESEDIIEEKLVVRWRTEGSGPNGVGGATSSSFSSSKSQSSSSSDLRPPLGSTSSSSNSSSSANTNSTLSYLLGGSAPIFTLSPTQHFTGLFIFHFDSKGRIVSHTIEHADEGNGYDRTAKVVSLTDWLLGKTRWGWGRRGEEPGDVVPGLCFERRRR